MATTLPLPPANTPVFDPQTGKINTLWQNYFNALETAIPTNAAPADAQYWVSTANGTLTAERNIGLLSSGYLKATVALGIATPSTVTAIPVADLSGTLTVAKGGTGLSSATASSVFITDGAGTPSWGATLPAVDGSALTNLNALQPLYRSVTPASNGTTVETTLFTYTLPAATLASDGDSVRIRVWGIAAANADTKTYRLYFGGTVLMTRATANAGNTAWIIDAEVSRTGAATQTAFGYWNASATGYLGIADTSPTETLSGTVVIKMTGQSDTASNDITGHCMAVDLVPAP